MKQTNGFCKCLRNGKSIITLLQLPALYRDDLQISATSETVIILKKKLIVKFIEYKLLV